MLILVDHGHDQLFGGKIEMTAAITVPSTLSMTTISAFADELRALPLDRDVVLDVADLSAPDLSVLQLIESLR